MKFSANLGYLWTELELVDAIHAAAGAGFDAIECHWPYAVPASLINAALGETNLPLLSLNTVRGNIDAGEFGLAALPGREREARAAIDQAFDYAGATGASGVHVMAGNAQGDAASATFLHNLEYACSRAATGGFTVLVEPINRFDAPDYFLRDSKQAVALIEALGAPNLRLMFDCYHVQRSEGDALKRLQAVLPIVGHIQIASVPERGAPDSGELDYRAVLRWLDEAGYDTPIGAEYRPAGATEDSLDWMSVLR